LSDLNATRPVIPGRELSRADSGKKNAALLAIAEQLASQADYLAAENTKDFEPPRRIQALPDFKHNAAASTVTLGRDS
jgi:gamma-glutamyl phosphate reductase